MRRVRARLRELLNKGENQESRAADRSMMMMRARKRHVRSCKGQNFRKCSLFTDDMLPFTFTFTVAIMVRRKRFGHLFDADRVGGTDGAGGEVVSDEAG